MGKDEKKRQIEEYRLKRQITRVMEYSTEDEIKVIVEAHLNELKNEKTDI